MLRKVNPIVRFRIICEFEKERAFTFAAYER